MMKERFFKSETVLVLMFCILAFFPGCADKEEVRTYKDYNVIFIAFDGLQAKHLNYYGYPLESTPNLDAFLNKSYVFEDAVSPASWTVPSYMSVFTSMYPSEHKLVNKFSGIDESTKQYIKSDFRKLSPDSVTLAWILKQNGYKTAAFTGDAGFSGGFGYNKGFDEYYDAVMFGGLDSSMPKAIDWLRKNKGEKFFLVLHGYDVHGQYAPAGGFDYRYVKGLYTGKYTGSKEEQGALREEGLANGRLNLSEEDVLFWRAVYDEKINRVDEKFSVFMKEAEDLGLMENTLFVVFSDHGTEFYEHKAFDHGHTLYGELIDVLYAIRLPGQKEGKKIDSLVSTLDTMPTVLRLLGIENPVPAQTRGIDLTPSFSGADVSRNQFSETDYRLYTHKRSVQTPEGWKLIVTYPGKEKELYDLKSDPSETINLAGKEAERTEELSKIIEQHLIDMNATGPWTLGCMPVYNDQCQASAPSSPDLKKKPSDKPNILLINIDSLRADHIGFYGYNKNTTPELDSYFARGVVFENAIATAPFTFQTDASILTSIYPSQNGVYTWKTPMREKTTIQEILKQEGYSTAAFVAPSLYYESGMFSHFDSFKLSEERKNLERSSEQVKEWIIKSEGPFFVFWHVYDVHLPYLRIADRFYPGTYDGPFFGSKYDTKWETQQSKIIELTDEYGNTINYTITQEDISYIRALYDNGVYLTDEGLGRLLRELEALGYLNNTILIISAEHGDDLWEHGRIFHSDIYDVNTHVPLMVLYPGCEPARIKEPVSSLDIAPTIIDFINVTVPQGFGGISLLSQDLDANRTIYSERPPFDEYSVRRGGWKYILRNPDLKANKSLEYITSIDEANRFFYILAIKDEGSGDELYYLPNDPHEKNNLIGKGHPMEAELRKLATDFREEMRKAKEDNRIGLEKVRTLPIFTYP